MLTASSLWYGGKRFYLSAHWVGRIKFLDHITNVSTTSISFSYSATSFGTMRGRFGCTASQTSTLRNPSGDIVEVELVFPTHAKDIPT
jgi:hypothetical protein